MLIEREKGSTRRRKRRKGWGEREETVGNVMVGEKGYEGDNEKRGEDFNWGMRRKVNTQGEEKER